MRQYCLTIIIILITGWNLQTSERLLPSEIYWTSQGVGGYASNSKLNEVLLQMSILKDNIEAIHQSYIYLQNEVWVRNSSNLNRYRNGIDIIKLLYEKLLDLDHHFTSLHTFNDIHELTNLNAYPEFIAVRETLINDTRQKSSIDLPKFLEQNIFITVGYTLLSSVFGEGTPSKRNDDINNIACLLDFTISMQSDLKMIFYETEFLHQSTKSLISKCQNLFQDYTSILNYNKSIYWCREKDDWELLDDRIMKLASNLSAQSLHSFDTLRQQKAIKQTTDIEFQITRLVGLMESYDSFISQGINYYSKFKTILDNYQNEENCVHQLPEEIQMLKQKIDLSIKKYTTAYSLVELQGSELKNLLYANQE